MSSANSKFSLSFIANRNKNNENIGNNSSNESIFNNSENHSDRILLENDDLNQDSIIGSRRSLVGGNISRRSLSGSNISRRSLSGSNISRRSLSGSIGSSDCIRRSSAVSALILTPHTEVTSDDSSRLQEQEDRFDSHRTGLMSKLAHESSISNVARENFTGSASNSHELRMDEGRPIPTGSSSSKRSSASSSSAKTSKFHQAPPVLVTHENRWGQFHTNDLEVQSIRASASAIATAATIYAKKIALIEEEEEEEEEDSDSNAIHECQNARTRYERDGRPRRISTKSECSTNEGGEPEMGYISMSLDLQKSDVSKLLQKHSATLAGSPSSYTFNKDPDGEGNIAFNLERGKMILQKLEEFSMEQNSNVHSFDSCTQSRSTNTASVQSSSLTRARHFGDASDNNNKHQVAENTKDHGLDPNNFKVNTITTRTDMMMKCSQQISELTIFPDQVQEKKKDKIVPKTTITSIDTDLENKNQQSESLKAPNVLSDEASTESTSQGYSGVSAVPYYDGNCKMFQNDVESEESDNSESTESQSSDIKNALNILSRSRLLRQGRMGEDCGSDSLQLHQGSDRIKMIDSSIKSDEDEIQLESNTNNYCTSKALGLLARRSMFIDGSISSGIVSNAYDAFADGDDSDESEFLPPAKSIESDKSKNTCVDKSCNAFATDDTNVLVRPKGRESESIDLDDLSETIGNDSHGEYETSEFNRTEEKKSKPSSQTISALSGRIFVEDDGGNMGRDCLSNGDDDDGEKEEHDSDCDVDRIESDGSSDNERGGQTIASKKRLSNSWVGPLLSEQDSQPIKSKWGGVRGANLTRSSFANSSDSSSTEWGWHDNLSFSSRGDSSKHKSSIDVLYNNSDPSTSRDLNAIDPSGQKKKRLSSKGLPIQSDVNYQVQDEARCSSEIENAYDEDEDPSNLERNKYNVQALDDSCQVYKDVSSQGSGDYSPFGSGLNEISMQGKNVYNAFESLEDKASYNAFMTNSHDDEDDSEDNESVGYDCGQAAVERQDGYASLRDEDIEKMDHSGGDDDPYVQSAPNRNTANSIMGSEDSLKDKASYNAFMTNSYDDEDDSEDNESVGYDCGQAAVERQDGYASLLDEDIGKMDHSGGDDDPYVQSAPNPDMALFGSSHHSDDTFDRRRFELRTENRPIPCELELNRPNLISPASKKTYIESCSESDGEEQRPLGDLITPYFYRNSLNEFKPLKNIPTSCTRKKKISDSSTSDYGEEGTSSIINTPYFHRSSSQRMEDTTERNSLSSSNSQNAIFDLNNETGPRAASTFSWRNTFFELKNIASGVDNTTLSADSTVGHGMDHNQSILDRNSRFVQSLAEIQFNRESYNLPLSTIVEESSDISETRTVGDLVTSGSCTIAECSNSSIVSALSNRSMSSSSVGAPSIFDYPLLRKMSISGNNNIDEVDTSIKSTQGEFNTNEPPSDAGKERFASLLGRSQEEFAIFLGQSEKVFVKSDDKSASPVKTDSYDDDDDGGFMPWPSRQSSLDSEDLDSIAEKIPSDKQGHVVSLCENKTVAPKEIEEEDSSTECEYEASGNTDYQESRSEAISDNSIEDPSAIQKILTDDLNLDRRSLGDSIDERADIAWHHKESPLATSASHDDGQQDFNAPHNDQSDIEYEEEGCLSYANDSDNNYSDLEGGNEDFLPNDSGSESDSTTENDVVSSSYEDSHERVPHGASIVSYEDSHAAVSSGTSITSHESDSSIGSGREAPHYSTTIECQGNTHEDTQEAVLRDTSITSHKGNSSIGSGREAPPHSTAVKCIGKTNESDNIDGRDEKKTIRFREEELFSKLTTMTTDVVRKNNSEVVNCNGHKSKQSFRMMHIEEVSNAPMTQEPSLSEAEGHDTIQEDSFLEYAGKVNSGPQETSLNDHTETMFVSNQKIDHCVSSEISSTKKERTPIMLHEILDTWHTTIPPQQSTSPIYPNSSGRNDDATYENKKNAVTMAMGASRGEQKEASPDFSELTAPEPKRSSLFIKDEVDGANRINTVNDIETGLTITPKPEREPLVGQQHKDASNTKSGSNVAISTGSNENDPSYIIHYGPTFSRCRKYASMLAILATVLALSISVVVLLQRQTSPPLTAKGIDSEIIGDPIGPIGDMKFVSKIWTEQASIAPDQYLDDRLGYTTALSADGTRLVVGGKDYSTESEANLGIVRIYNLFPMKDQSIKVWKEIAFIIGKKSNDQFGAALSLSADGTILVVGAPGHDIGSSDDTNEGKVFVYDISANNSTPWETEISSFEGEDEGGEFGFSVSLESRGNNLAIGAPLRNNAVGGVFVYTKDNRGTWYQLGDALTGTSQNEEFGFSVSIALDGVQLVVGAPGNTASFPGGYIMVYRHKLYKWDEDELLTVFTSPGARFGHSISQSPDAKFCLIGAPGSENQRGSAYFFSRVNGAFDEAISEITGFEEGDRLGWSVSISLQANRFVIGLPGRGKSDDVQFGSTLIYQVGKDSSLEMSKEIYGEGEPGEKSDFGSSVALNNNGTTVVISSPSTGVIRSYI